MVVTGLGVVSPIGIGKDAFWQSLINGECGIDYVTRFDASTYPCRFAAEVKDFEPKEFMSPKTARFRSRGSQFAIVSTQKALEDAQLDFSKEDPYLIGVCYGTSVGPIDIYERFGGTFYERGLRRVKPLFEGLMNHNAMVGGLAEFFNIRGYNLTVSTACSAGNVAVANAYHAVSSEMADILITGGVDTPIYPLTYGLYAASNVMAPNNRDPRKAMCPYDKRRAGYVLGEGAGTLILEEMEHAQRRGARIYAEILGFGLTNDAVNANFLRSDVKDMSKAFQFATSHALLRPEDVDYICGHSHSSVMMDKRETEAVKDAFGEHAYKLAMSSIKAAVGQSMAGATAMQGITACLALHQGILPPTLNYEEPDPELDLDYVPNQARRKEIQIAMVNSWGLGGTNIVVAYKKI